MDIPQGDTSWQYEAGYGTGVATVLVMTSWTIGKVLKTVVSIVEGGALPDSATAKITRVTKKVGDALSSPVDYLAFLIYVGVSDFFDRIAHTSHSGEKASWQPPGGGYCRGIHDVGIIQENMVPLTQEIGKKGKVPMMAEESVIAIYAFVHEKGIPKDIENIINDSSHRAEYNALMEHYVSLSPEARTELEKKILDSADSIKNIHDILAVCGIILPEKDTETHHPPEMDIPIGDDPKEHIMEGEEFNQIGTGFLSLQEVENLYRKGELSENERNFLLLAWNNTSTKKGNC